MKSNLKAVSLVMLVSLVFSGSLFVYIIKNTVMPALTDGGVDLYVYVILAAILAAFVLKLIVGINGFTALSYKTSEPDRQKKLTLGGKLCVPIVACGLLCLFLKLFYGDTFLVADIFDIILNVLSGVIYIICSMYVRAGRE